MAEQGSAGGMSKEEIIAGLERAINNLKGMRSDYWRGVRDGYKSALKFIHGPHTLKPKEE